MATKASLEPSFLDVVFTFYLFVTNGTDLIREDAGLGSVAIGIDAQRSMEMGIARFNYGSDHVEQKLYEDLNVRKNELGPNDAITTGNFS